MPQLQSGRLFSLDLPIELGQVYLPLGLSMQLTPQALQFSAGIMKVDLGFFLEFIVHNSNKYYYKLS